MTEDLQKWVDPAMFASEPMPEARPRVHLISATQSPIAEIASVCKMYKGEVVRNIEEISLEEREHYWKEVQKTHLQAPLEFVDFHFLIEGVTRAFTHQLVRQRTAVYAQESLRFAVKEGFSSEIPLPPSLVGAAENSEGVSVWRTAIQRAEEGYEALVNMGVPAEDARGLLPHSITTRVHYKTNLRNLIEHAGNRLCTQAQFEWRLVFTELVKSIREYESYPPIQNLHWEYAAIADSDLFRPVCYAKGKCPFNADFDRGCTIRPRVEEGKFDEIDPAEWLLDPAAARRGI